MSRLKESHYTIIVRQITWHHPNLTSTECNQSKTYYKLFVRFNKRYVNLFSNSIKTIYPSLIPFSAPLTLSLPRFRVRRDFRDRSIESRRGTTQFDFTLTSESISALTLWVQWKVFPRKHLSFRHIALLFVIIITTTSWVPQPYSIRITYYTDDFWITDIETSNHKLKILLCLLVKWEENHLCPKIHTLYMNV